MAFLPRLMARILKFKFASGWQGEGLDRVVVHTVYGNDIALRLKRIHAHPERDGFGGGLIVVLYGRTSAHVRCKFVDNGRLLICEARPGRDTDGTDVLPISTETESALQKVGYYRDPSNGRLLFRYEITTDSAIWGGASVAILDPLTNVFGARVESKIEIVAPLAPLRDEAAIRREIGGL